MISNLPDDVVHDLLRDLGDTSNTINDSVYCGECGNHIEFTRTDDSSEKEIKNIIEQWEANRDKYLKDIDRGRVAPRRTCFDAGRFQSDHLISGRLPDGSGFIVP